MRLMLIVVALATPLLLAGCSVYQASKIESAVLEALAADEELSQFSFDVTYQDDGQVYITGEVFSPEQFDRVAIVAERVSNVAGVINKCSLPEEGSNMIQDTTATDILGF